MMCKYIGDWLLAILDAIEQILHVITDSLVLV